MKRLLLLACLLFLTLTSFYPFEKNDSEDYGHVDAVAFSHNNKYVASGGQGQKIDIWDINNGEKISSITVPHNIYKLDYSPDDKFVAGAIGHTTFVYDAATGALVKTYALKNNYSKINTVKYTPDGKYLITGSNDNTIKIWDLATDKVIKTLKGHKEYVLCLAVSKDGKYLLSSGWDNTAIYWDLTTGKQIKVLKPKGESWHKVENIALSNDCKTAVLCNSGKTSVWNLETGLLSYELPEAYANSTDVVFSKDEKHFFLSRNEDKNLYVFETSTGTYTSTYTGHSQEINCIGISPDGNLVATGGDDNSLILWNYPAGTVANKILTSLASNSWTNTYNLVGTKNGVTLYMGELSGDKIFKVVNANGYAVTVRVVMLFECGSMSAMGGASYDNTEVVKNMVVNQNSTRSADDANKTDYVQGMCKKDTRSAVITSWTVTPY